MSTHSKLHGQRMAQHMKAIGPIEGNPKGFANGGWAGDNNVMEPEPWGTDNNTMKPEPWGHDNIRIEPPAEVKGSEPWRLENQFKEYEKKTGNKFPGQD